jgi:hypothetical protein
MLTHWLRGFRGAAFRDFRCFLGVAVELSSLSTTATTSIDDLGATSGGFLRVEDLLWGWLLRWELEEACAAVVGFDARLFDGALIRWRG